MIPMQVHLCSAGPQARVAPTMIRRTVQLRKKFLQEVKPPIRVCVCVHMYIRTGVRVGEKSLPHKWLSGHPI